MSDDHAIIEAESVEIVEPMQSGDLHPMVRLLANQGDLNAETMERLMAMQERHDALMAERIFNDARSKLLDDLPAVVPKNRKVSFSGSSYTYADLPQVMRSVMPALRKHGFSVSWTNGREGRDEIVTCHLSHRCGHSVTNERRGTPESRKAQSDVQACQSTVTYLQRQSLLAILGIVTDDTPDADERRPPPPEEIPIEERRRRAVIAIEKAGRRLEDAVAHLGHKPQQWTADDLTALRGWLQEEEAGS